MGKASLLQYILIIGALFLVVLVAFNPLEFAAQGRDKDKIAFARRVGSALEDYARDHEGGYPNQESWIQVLVDGEYVNSIPDEAHFKREEDGAIAYFNLEAAQNNRKCAIPEHAWVVYSTANARVGTICAADGGPQAGLQDFID